MQATDTTPRDLQLFTTAPGSKSLHMPDISSALPRAIPGPLIPKSPLEFKGAQYATTQTLVEQIAYNLSATIFDYSPASFELDAAVKAWSAAGKTNLAGHVPDLVELESRIGAATGLLGYLAAARGEQRTSVLLSAGGLALMEPVLRQNKHLLARANVVFHVAAVAYNETDGQLINDYADVVRVSRALGWPLIAGSLGDSADVQKTALAATSLAAAGPVVHVYDGIRGSRQAVPAKVIDPASYKDLKSTSSVEAALAAFDLKPIEYEGGEDSLVVVTIGDALASAVTGAGVVNVRAVSGALGDAVLAALPASVTRVAVLDNGDLYREVSTAVHFRYGIGRGPVVDSITAFTPSELATALGVAPKSAVDEKSAVFLDSDRSSTAAAPATLARYAGADIFSVYDNFIAGGVLESDVRLDAAAPWIVETAPFVYAGNAQIASHINVAERTVVGGTLIVAASGDALQKLPALIRRTAAARKLNVYSLDYSQLDHSNTQGRTNSMALQGLFWHFVGKLSLDDATSKVVQANGQDTELVAATVNKLIASALEKALVAVDTKEWADAKEPEKNGKIPEDPILSSVATPTSFLPTEVDVEAPAVSELSKTEIAQRFAFREAFDQASELRPDLATKNFIAKVKTNQRVTPSNYDRHIFHLELDITGTGLKYAIGEALGVHAPNNEQDVKEFIEWYGIDADEIVGVPHRDDPEVLEYKTAFQALRDNLDLFGKVPKRFYEALANYASDDKQRASLEHLITAGGAEDLKKRTEVDFVNYVDILKEFSSARPAFASLVEMVAPLKRREYSIASSQKAHPNEVHLLIVVVDWVNAKGETKYGQCSKFLADLERGEEVTVSVKPSVLRLPKDPKAPVIMAGLGTGLAPFKAFLEEKQWQRDNGEEIGDIYLFLGSRHQREEYLYGELFEAYKNAGVLTHIGAAFSRDQPEKIYIQHRISQAKAQLIDAFVKKGGNFYLCGPTWPVPDISAALSDIVATEAAERGEKVDEDRLIEDLKDAERYVLEVY